MREILFRGKSNWEYRNIKKGDWLYGMTIAPHCYSDEEITSYYIGGGNKTIDAKTLGEYTGFTDMNGNKIFEGDILKFADRLGYVFWHAHLGCWDTAFIKYIDRSRDRVDMSPCRWKYVAEVVGNIHDNPELLKGVESDAR